MSEWAKYSKLLKVQVALDNERPGPFVADSGIINVGGILRLNTLSLGQLLMLASSPPQTQMALRMW